MGDSHHVWRQIQAAMVEFPDEIARLQIHLNALREDVVHVLEEFLKYDIMWESNEGEDIYFLAPSNREFTLVLKCRIAGYEVFTLELMRRSMGWTKDGGLLGEPVKYESNVCIIEPDASRTADEEETNDADAELEAENRKKQKLGDRENG